MFFCKPCGDQRGWQSSIGKSYGPCEICGNARECSDVPSRLLPPARVQSKPVITLSTESNIRFVIQTKHFFLPEEWADLDLRQRFTTAEEALEYINTNKDINPDDYRVVRRADRIVQCP